MENNSVSIILASSGGLFKALSNAHTLGRLREFAMDSEDVHLSAPQVRRRYGARSDMWLWRLLRDNRSGFPKPLVINNRRYWLLSELRQWEASQAFRCDTRLKVCRSES